MANKVENKKVETKEGVISDEQLESVAGGFIYPFSDEYIESLRNDHFASLRERYPEYAEYFDY